MDQPLTTPTGPAVAPAMDPTRPTPGFCRCGCGAPVARRYRPGHDAKHHSTLAAALRGDWRQAARAADLLAALGWTSYAEAADLRAVPYRASNGIAQQAVSDVARWQVTPSGLHHSNRRCPALTAEARAAGRLNATTHLAADSWLTFAEGTPALAARLAQSFDQCTDCSTTHSRDEVAEAAQVLASQLRGRDEPTPRKTDPTSWTVAPDLVGQPPIHRTWNHSTGKLTSTPGLAPPLAA